MRKLRPEELNRPSLETYSSGQRLPIVVIADNIRSGLNIGSIFRTADAFGIERIILTGISAQPPHKEINKTAIGATESVAWSYCEDVATAVTQLKTEGYIIIGIEQTNQSEPLSSFKLEGNEKVAVLFGNEVNGLSETVLPLLDLAIEIPQYGTKHSLNVSVCGGIILYQLSQYYR